MNKKRVVYSIIFLICSSVLVFSCIEFFRKAAGAEDVAKAGVKALEKGRVLAYPGAFVKTMNILSRLAPRSVTRKSARRMNH